MKDENQSEAISSSFIPHPSSFITPLHPCTLAPLHRKHRRARITQSALKACACLLVCLLTSVAAQTSYEKDIQTWRAQQEAQLKSDDGWLTVVGLFWLKEGANRFGTDPSNEIVLPEGYAPARAGVFEFHKGKVTLRVSEGVTVKANGRDAPAREMKSDADGNPDIIAIGDATMHIIERNERFGVRVKDKNSRQRREFTGLRWFPVQESYRIIARFVSYDKPKEIPIPNVLGDVVNMPSPGYVVFNLAGRESRLEPVMSGRDQLFFIFSDSTTGKATYPAGRFLYAEMPEDGRVTLDFNKAVNPPCAFTDFATCPLPPPQNRLKVAIEAGELAYHSKGH